MPRRQRLLDKMADLPNRGFNWISGGALLAIMCLIVANIVLRASPAVSIIGTYELTQFLMVFVVFLAVAYAQVYKRHIVVQAIADRLPIRVQAVLVIIANLLGLVLFTFVSWRSISYGLDLLDIGRVTMMLKIPEGVFYFMTTVGCILFCFVLLAHLIESVRELRK